MMNMGPATRETVEQICDLVEEHHEWRRSCLNMIASESVTSPLVETILASDLSRRYREGYRGTRYFLELLDLTTELAQSVFGCQYVDVRPVTGHVAVLAAITALTEPGDKIATMAPEDGGYPLRFAEWAGIDLVYYPFDLETFNVEVDGTREQILGEKPNVVVFGQSKYLFPSPVAALAETAHGVGATIWYDGAHVMGMLAGGQFPDPLQAGADLVTGSTHKTIPGPQRGIVLTNDEDIRDRIADVLSDNPLLVSTIHDNTIAALAVALAEFSAFGAEYAEQVVKNARALGKTLVEEGVSVVGADRGITDSHQVLLAPPAFGSPEAAEAAEKLEDAGIISTSNRLGTQEITRLGMKEPEMERIGHLIADVLLDRGPVAQVRQDTRSLAAGHQSLHYSFQDGEDAYAIIGELL